MEHDTDRPGYEPQLTEPPRSDGPVAQLNSAQRLWMVFTSPIKVFEDIGVKPTWVLCMVLLVALGLIAQLVILPHIDAEATIRARFEARGTEVSEEQVETLLEQSEKFSKFAPIIGLVVGPIFWAILAAIFFVILKIVGSEADYVKSLSTTMHAYWPPSVVATILTSVLIQRMGKIPQDEIVNVVKSHLGAFLSSDAPAWLTAAASTISIFNIWTVVLLIIGFSTVGKISRGKAAVVALLPWIVYLIGKAGVAFLTS